MKSWKWIVAIAVVIGLVMITRGIRAGRPGPGARLAQPVVAETKAIVETPAANPVATRAKSKLAKFQAHEMPGGTNAADLYKDAFVLYDALSEEEKKMIAHPKDEVEEAKADELFKKLAPIMELVRKAAAADYCDWGTGQLNASTPTPFLSKAMEIGKVALWASAYEFPKDPLAAVADLTTRDQIGMNLPPSMIGLLVETSLRSTGLDLLREYVGAIPKDGSANVAALTKATRPADAFARGMEGEAELMNGLFETIMKSPDRDLLLKQAGASGDSFDQLFEKDDLRLKAQLEWNAKIALESKDALSRTDQQFQTWFVSVAQRTAVQPIIEQFFPILNAAYARARTAQIQGQMVAAALDISQSGPAAVGAFRDPATGAPFVYTETADGFMLSSTFLQQGKPVTMTFPW